MEIKRIFFDMEFDGLRQDTKMISIGAVSDCGPTFYMENSAFDKEAADPWVKENVLPLLEYKGYKPGNTFLSWGSNGNLSGYGPLEFIAEKFVEWVLKFKHSPKIELWADVKEYDAVLFNDLMNRLPTGIKKPESIHYIIHDFATLLWAKGYDCDIDRKKLAYGDVFPEGINAHNAEKDAIMLKTAFEKVSGI